MHVTAQSLRATETATAMIAVLFLAAVALSAFLVVVVRLAFVTQRKINASRSPWRYGLVGYLTKQWWQHDDPPPPPPPPHYRDRY